MKITPEFRIKFKSLLKEQKGVFSSSDLWAIVSPTSSVDFYRQIKKLEKEKLVYKVCRGFYVAKNFSKAHLIMAMKPEAYLSLEFALAYYNLIGTYTENKIRPILAQVNRNIESDMITIDYKKIKEDLIFGHQVIDGIRIATKEKAFLDTLYFYQKGVKFYFDIYSDIEIEVLDKKVIHKYLKKYKNPKFIKFVQDYLNV
jgi:hypothetical protein